MFQCLPIVLLLNYLVIDSEGIRSVDFPENAGTWLNPGDDILLSKHTPIYFVSDHEKIDKDDDLFHSIMLQKRVELDRGSSSSVSKSRSPHRRLEKKDGVPSVVYPEILVMISFELFEKFSQDIEQLVPYVYVLMNAVNLNFRGIEDPRYRLNIAGLVVAKDAKAFSFITLNTGILLADNGTYLFSLNALGYSGKWLYRHKDDIPLDSYDVALTLTSLDLCPSFENKEHCEKTAFYGVSYEQSACGVSDPDDLVVKVGIVTHQGVYDRVNSITHELGHLFGVSHDGESAGCSDQSGFMMTSLTDYRNTTRWSRCSLTQFSQYLRNGGSCMFNKPQPGPHYPTYLPGKIMDAKEQCSRDPKWPHACFQTDDTICANFQCQKHEINKRQKCHKMGYTAPAGTSCGEGKICFNKMCIEEKLLMP